jgi:hypothetical protein
LLDRALALCRVDFAPPHRQPSAARLAAATVLSLAGSLAADAALVAIGTRVFPSTQGYVHFRFHDYAKLTVIGVVIACLAWPVVTRISAQPRWLFFRLAVLVTLVLWLPDLYLLAKGQPPEAVAVLMVMHLAIALVTYNCLVHVAKVGATGGPGHETPPPRHAAPRRGQARERKSFSSWARSASAVPSPPPWAHCCRPVAMILKPARSSAREAAASCVTTSAQSRPSSIILMTPPI